MKKAKRVLYNVECAYNPDHVFEKVFTIEEESEGMESEVQAYCGVMKIILKRHLFFSPFLFRG